MLPIALVVVIVIVVVTFIFIVVILILINTIIRSIIFIAMIVAMIRIAIASIIMVASIMAKLFDIVVTIILIHLDRHYSIASSLSHGSYALVFMSVSSPLVLDVGLADMSIRISDTVFTSFVWPWFLVPRSSRSRGSPSLSP